MSSQEVQSVDHSSNKAVYRWAGAVLLVAVLLRLVLWELYSPVTYSDTPSYYRSAQAVRDGFTSYDGTRTPGYPLFLAFFGSDQHVWLAQMGLGVAITMLFFYLGWRLSGQAWFGGLVALAHTLNLGQLFFEANLLTETLTTFWIVLTLAGLLFWLTTPRRRSFWLAAGLGFASAMAALTRPLFIYLPAWVLLFILFSRETVPAQAQPSGAQSGQPVNHSPRLIIHWIPALSFLVPVLLILGGWLSFIHSRFGDWSLTTMTGYHLVQHTGSFFEYVPDEYASLRDTYITFRDAHIARYGTQTNTIWEAIPAMQQASGLSFYDLSRVLASISIQLIRGHPDLYLANVLNGWWLFWRAPVYWSATALRWAELARPVLLLVQLERLLLAGINLLFIASSVLALIFHQRLPVSGGRRNFLYCLLGTVWIASILQTMIDHGDNPRFLLPLQSLVVFWVLWTGWQVFMLRKSTGES